jgi:PhnB protein
MSRIPTSWSLVPYLRVADADAAIAFYEKAFGAKLVAAMPGPDGKLKMHVELDLNGTRLYFADRRIMGGGSDPVPNPDDAPVVLHVNVPDAVAAADRALKAGCTERLKVSTQFWGDIYGQVVDPYGFVWAFLTPGEPKSESEIAEAMKTMTPSS